MRKEGESVTKYAFNDVSIDWLKENGFNDDEIDTLQDLLNRYEGRKRAGNARLPSDTSVKVSALLALLEAITDADGMPICLEESGLINIPDEAMEYFEEDLELEELERITGKLSKVKFAKRYSDPRRRGSMKENDRSGF